MAITTKTGKGNNDFRGKIRWNLKPILTPSLLLLRSRSSKCVLVRSKLPSWKPSAGEILFSAKKSSRKVVFNFKAATTR